MSIPNANLQRAGQVASMLDLPRGFQLDFHKANLSEVNQKIKQVLETSMKMKRELNSLDSSQKELKKLVALKTNLTLVLAPLELLKSALLSGSEDLSREEPDEYTYSPYEKFMNSPNQAVDIKLKSTLGSLNEIDFGLELDDLELREKIEAYKKNLEALKTTLALPLVNSRGSAYAHIETVLATINGMHDKRRDEEGILELTKKKLEREIEPQYTNPQRAALLIETLKKADSVFKELLERRQRLEEAIQLLEPAPIS